MVSFAIALATKLVMDVGCRVVLANSEPDAVGFYEKMGFERFTAQPPPYDSSGPCHDPHTQRNAEADGLVPMYIDLKQDLSVTRELVDESVGG